MVQTAHNETIKAFSNHGHNHRFCGDTWQTTEAFYPFLNVQSVLNTLSHQYTSVIISIYCVQHVRSIKYSVLSVE
jgi:hypothetical protein